jgi:O-antigen/teichoic acid export membrane protein
MASVRASIAITGISQYVTIFLSFIKVIVVSRLLTPEAIGVFAIAMPVLFFVRAFRVFGTWDYIVSRQEITDSDLRLCFTISVLVSLLTGAGLYLSANSFAVFFDASALSPVLRLMAVSAFIFPFGVVSQALFQRNMRFGALAKIQVVSTIVETAVAVIMVILGYGVISLAWGFVCASLSAIVVVALIERKYFILRPQFQGGFKVLRFGVMSWLSTTFNQFSELLPALLLGKILGASALGFFSRGQTPVTIFRQAIDTSSGRVAHSWFAQISRVDASKLSTVYLKVMRLTAGISWPFAVMLFFHADSLIPILLGDQWAQSIPVAKVLSISLMFTPYTFYGTKLLLARGQVGRQLWFEIIAQTIRVTLLVVSVFYGITAFAGAIALSSIISAIIVTVFLKKSIDLQFSDVFRCLGSSLLIALAVTFPNIVLYEFIVSGARLTIYQLMITLIANVSFWFGALFVTKHDLWIEVENVWNKVVVPYYKGNST